MRNYKKLFIIFIVLSFLVLVPVSFASPDYSLDNADNVQEGLAVANLSNSNLNKTLFIISDSPGTNILDSASDDIYNAENLSGFNIVLRSGEQVKDMDGD